MVQIVRRVNIKSIQHPLVSVEIIKICKERERTIDVPRRDVALQEDFQHKYWREIATISLVITNPGLKNAIKEHLDLRTINTGHHKAQH